MFSDVREKMKRVVIMDWRFTMMEKKWVVMMD